MTLDYYIMLNAEITVKLQLSINMNIFVNCTIKLVNV